MPAAYARPCGKRGRTDAADAEAVCEAVSRPTTRFAPVKPAERQAGRLDHKAREFLVRRRTRIVDGMRARLAESGIFIAKGAHNLDRLLATVEAAPEATRPALASLADRLRDTHDRIAAVTARIEAAQGEDPFARRLASAPGIGTIPASALATTTPNVPVHHLPKIQGLPADLVPAADFVGRPAPILLTQDADDPPLRKPAPLHSRLLRVTNPRSIQEIRKRQVIRQSTPGSSASLTDLRFKERAARPPACGASPCRPGVLRAGCIRRAGGPGRSSRGRI